MCPLGVKWGHMKLWTEAHGLFSAELASPTCTREGVERKLVGEGRTAALSAMSQREITQPESLTRQPLAAALCSPVCICPGSMFSNLALDAQHEFRDLIQRAKAQHRLARWCLSFLLLQRLRQDDD